MWPFCFKCFSQTSSKQETFTLTKAVFRAMSEVSGDQIVDVEGEISDSDDDEITITTKALKVSTSRGDKENRPNGRQGSSMSLREKAWGARKRSSNMSSCSSTLQSSTSMSSSSSTGDHGVFKMQHNEPNDNDHDHASVEETQKAGVMMEFDESAFLPDEMIETQPVESCSTMSSPQPSPTLYQPIVSAAGSEAGKTAEEEATANTSTNETTPETLNECSPGASGGTKATVHNNYTPTNNLPKYSEKEFTLAVEAAVLEARKEFGSVNAELKEEIKGQQESFEEKLVKREQEVESLKSKLMEKDTQIEQTKTAHDAEYEEMISKLDLFEKENNAKVEAANLACSEKEAEIEASKLAVSEKEAVLSAVTSQLADHQKTIDSLQAKVSQLEDNNGFLQDSVDAATLNAAEVEKKYKDEIQVNLREGRSALHFVPPLTRTLTNLFSSSSSSSSSPPLPGYEVVAQSGSGSSQGKKNKGRGENEGRNDEVRRVPVR